MKSYQNWTHILCRLRQGVLFKHFSFFSRKTLFGEPTLSTLALQCMEAKIDMHLLQPEVDELLKKNPALLQDPLSTYEKPPLSDYEKQCQLFEEYIVEHPDDGYSDALHKFFGQDTPFHRQLLTTTISHPLHQPREEPVTTATFLSRPRLQIIMFSFPPKKERLQLLCCNAK